MLLKPCVEVSLHRLCEWYAPLDPLEDDIAQPHLGIVLRVGLGPEYILAQGLEHPCGRDEELFLWGLEEDVPVADIPFVCALKACIHKVPLGVCHEIVREDELASSHERDDAHLIETQLQR